MLTRLKIWIGKILYHNGIKDVVLKALYHCAQYERNSLSFIYKWIWRLSFGYDSFSYDRDVDVYYRWPNEGEFMWAETASINLMALNMFDAPKVLDLGCSTGFFANRLYSFVPNIKYLGCDLDTKAIQHAQKAKTKLWTMGKGTELEFYVADFLNDMPLEGEDLTNVIWTESMNMFDEEEQRKILANIKLRLSKENGILSGSCLTKCDGVGMWQHYKGLFENVDAVKKILSDYFDNVYVFPKPERYYGVCLFMASSGRLPLEIR